MAIACYLAMTAAEMRMACQPSAQIAWMACHFSPYGTGLSNLPKALPPGSVLMLNDRTPIHGHDPEWIGKQLRQSVQNLGCRGVLLDFQRPEQKETAALVSYLVEKNAFPLAVSQSYGAELDCPILLPPVPLDLGLETYLMPWQGREIWLELALDGMEITLTETGAVCKSLEWAAQQSGRKEEKLQLPGGGNGAASPVSPVADKGGSARPAGRSGKLGSCRRGGAVSGTGEFFSQGKRLLRYCSDAAGRGGKINLISV